MPQQLKRLLIAFLIFISLFLIIRHFLVPESFGKYGHYRADALNDNELHEIKFVNSKECSNCHFEIDSIKGSGFHKSINCQTCHGPANKHIEDPTTNILEKPSERDFCGKCHEKNSARPTFVKQIDIKKHNIGSKCINCHKPHSPSLKIIVSNTSDTTVIAKKINDATCGMCHSEILNYKTSGVHKSVNCQSCHGSGVKHIENPSSSKMIKPQGRKFCGSCHGKGSSSSSNIIKQIDLGEHNTDSQCVECHKPHSPLDF